MKKLVERRFVKCSSYNIYILHAHIYQHGFMQYHEYIGINHGGGICHELTTRGTSKMLILYYTKTRYTKVDRIVIRLHKYDRVKLIFSFEIKIGAQNDSRTNRLFHGTHNNHVRII